MSTTGSPLDSFSEKFKRYITELPNGLTRKNESDSYCYIDYNTVKKTNQEGFCKYIVEFTTENYISEIKILVNNEYPKIIYITSNDNEEDYAKQLYIYTPIIELGGCKYYEWNNGNGPAWLYFGITDGGNDESAWDGVFRYSGNYNEYNEYSSGNEYFSFDGDEPFYLVSNIRLYEIKDNNLISGTKYFMRYKFTDQNQNIFWSDCFEFNYDESKFPNLNNETPTTPDSNICIYPNEPIEIYFTNIKNVTTNSATIEFFIKNYVSISEINTEIMLSTDLYNIVCPADIKNVSYTFSSALFSNNDKYGTIQVHLTQLPENTNIYAHISFYNRSDFNNGSITINQDDSSSWNVIHFKTKKYGDEITTSPIKFYIFGPNEIFNSYNLKYNDIQPTIDTDSNTLFFHYYIYDTGCQQPENIFLCYGKIKGENDLNSWENIIHIDNHNYKVESSNRTSDSPYTILPTTSSSQWVYEYVETNLYQNGNFDIDSYSISIIKIDIAQLNIAPNEKYYFSIFIQNNKNDIYWSDNILSYTLNLSELDILSIGNSLEEKNMIGGTDALIHYSIENFSYKRSSFRLNVGYDGTVSSSTPTHNIRIYYGKNNESLTNKWTYKKDTQMFISMNGYFPLKKLEPNTTYYYQIEHTANYTSQNSPIPFQNFITDVKSFKTKNFKIEILSTSINSNKLYITFKIIIANNDQFNTILLYDNQDYEYDINKWNNKIDLGLRALNENITVEIPNIKENSALFYRIYIDDGIENSYSDIFIFSNYKNLDFAYNYITFDSYDNMILTSYFKNTYQQFPSYTLKIYMGESDQETNASNWNFNQTLLHMNTTNSAPQTNFNQIIPLIGNSLYPIKSVYNISYLTQSNNASTILLGKLSQKLTLLFSDVPFENGATVPPIYLYMNGITSSGSNFNITIKAFLTENADNDSYSTGPTLTTTSIIWTPSFSSILITPDVSSIVQEIVNLPEWKTNNKIRFVFYGANDSNYITISSGYPIGYNIPSIIIGNISTFSLNQDTTYYCRLCSYNHVTNFESWSEPFTFSKNKFYYNYLENIDNITYFDSNNDFTTSGYSTSYDDSNKIAIINNDIIISLLNPTNPTTLNNITLFGIFNLRGKIFANPAFLWGYTPGDTSSISSWSFKNTSITYTKSNSNASYIFYSYFNNIKYNTIIYFCYTFTIDGIRYFSDIKSTKFVENGFLINSYMSEPFNISHNSITFQKNMNIVSYRQTSTQAIDSNIIIVCDTKDNGDDINKWNQNNYIFFDAFNPSPVTASSHPNSWLTIDKLVSKQNHIKNLESNTTYYYRAFSKLYNASSNSLNSYYCLFPHDALTFITKNKLNYNNNDIITNCSETPLINGSIIYLTLNNLKDKLIDVYIYSGPQDGFDDISYADSPTSITYDIYNIQPYYINNLKLQEWYDDNSIQNNSPLIMNKWLYKRKYTYHISNNDETITIPFTQFLHKHRNVECYTNQHGNNYDGVYITFSSNTKYFYTIYIKILDNNQYFKLDNSRSFITSDYNQSHFIFNDFILSSPDENQVILHINDLKYINNDAIKNIQPYGYLYSYNDDFSNAKTYEISEYEIDYYNIDIKNKILNGDINISTTDSTSNIIYIKPIFEIYKHDIASPINIKYNYISKNALSIKFKNDISTSKNFPVLYNDININNKLDTKQNSYTINLSIFSNYLSKNFKLNIYFSSNIDNLELIDKYELDIQLINIKNGTYNAQLDKISCDFSYDFQFGKIYYYIFRLTNDFGTFTSDILQFNGLIKTPSDKNLKYIFSNISFSATTTYTILEYTILDFCSYANYITDIITSSNSDTSTLSYLAKKDGTKYIPSSQGTSNSSWYLRYAYNIKENSLGIENKYFYLINKINNNTLKTVAHLISKHDDAYKDIYNQNTSLPSQDNAITKYSYGGTPTITTPKISITSLSNSFDNVNIELGIQDEGNDICSIFIFYGLQDCGVNENEWDYYQICPYTFSSSYGTPPFINSSLDIDISSAPHLYVKAKISNSINSYWTDTQFINRLIPFTCTNLDPITINVTTTLIQGLIQGYSKNNNLLVIYYGEQDGGHNANIWDFKIEYDTHATYNNSPISILLLNLKPGTKYFYTYGLASPSKSFVTKHQQDITTPNIILYPEISDNVPYNITNYRINIGGKLISTGFDTTIITIYYDTVDKFVISDNWSNKIIIGTYDTPQDFYFDITTLSKNTTYYIRASASNSLTTSWSEAIIVTTNNDNFPILSLQEPTITYTSLDNIIPSSFFQSRFIGYFTITTNDYDIESIQLLKNYTQYRASLDSSLLNNDYSYNNIVNYTLNKFSNNTIIYIPITTSPNDFIKSIDNNISYGLKINSKYQENSLIKYMTPSSNLANQKSIMSYNSACFGNIILEKSNFNSLIFNIKFDLLNSSSSIYKLYIFYIDENTYISNNISNYTYQNILSLFNTYDPNIYINASSNKDKQTILNVELKNLKEDTSYYICFGLMKTSIKKSTNQMVSSFTFISNYSKYLNSYSYNYITMIRNTTKSTSNICTKSNILKITKSSETDNIYDIYYPNTGTDTGYWTGIGEFYPTGYNGTSLGFGRYSSWDETAYILFKNINIPSNKTITNAYISFYTGSNNGLICDVNILGDKSSLNPSAPTSRTNGINRTKTTSSVNWIVPTTQPSILYQTPDISSIINEITSQPGWSNGNNILLYISEHNSNNNAYRGMYSYNNGSLYPSLNISTIDELYIWKWENDNNPWIEYLFTQHRNITKITIQAMELNYQNSPSHIIIKGSNQNLFNGEESFLFEVENIIWSASEIKTFEFSNMYDYLYYRIYFPSSPNGTIKDIQMYEISDDAKLNILPSLLNNKISIYQQSKNKYNFSIINFENVLSNDNLWLAYDNIDKGENLNSWANIQKCNSTISKYEKNIYPIDYTNYGYAYNTTFITKTNTIQFGHNANNISAWILFNSINIPKNAIIEDARIYIKNAYQTNWNKTNTISINILTSNNIITSPPSTLSDFTSISLNTNSISRWDIYFTEADNSYQTSTLTSCNINNTIQSIIDNNNWNYGNSLFLVLQNINASNSYIQSINNMYYPPQLTIKWSINTEYISPLNTSAQTLLELTENTKYFFKFFLENNNNIISSNTYSLTTNYIFNKLPCFTVDEPTNISKNSFRLAINILDYGEELIENIKIFYGKTKGNIDGTNWENEVDVIPRQQKGLCGKSLINLENFATYFYTVIVYTQNYAHQLNTIKSLSLHNTISYNQNIISLLFYKIKNGSIAIVGDYSSIDIYSKINNFNMAFSHNALTYKQRYSSDPAPASNSYISYLTYSLSTYEQIAFIYPVNTNDGFFEYEISKEFAGNQLYIGYEYNSSNDYIQQTTSKLMIYTDNKNTIFTTLPFDIEYDSVLNISLTSALIYGKIFNPLIKISDIKINIHYGITQECEHQDEIVIDNIEMNGSYIYIRKILNDLESNTIYYFKFESITPLETRTSIIYNFTTSASLPTISLENTIINNEFININANLLDDGNSKYCNITLYWGTTNGNNDSTQWENVIQLGPKDIGIITYDLNLTLNDNTTYYYQFSAENAMGINWTDVKQISKTINPEISISPTDIHSTDAFFKSIITNIRIDNYQLYFCHGQTNAQNMLLDWENVKEIKNFNDIIYINNLHPNTKYFYRLLLITPSLSTIWSEPNTSFSTLEQNEIQPLFNTYIDSNNITDRTGIISINILNDIICNITIEYGIFSSMNGPLTLNTITLNNYTKGYNECTLNNLKPSSQYYYRVIIENAIYPLLTSTNNDIYFYTEQSEILTISNNPIFTNIKANSITLTFALLTNLYENTSAIIYYGKILNETNDITLWENALSIQISSNPTSINITQLSKNTIYYLQIYIENTSSNTTSQIFSFTTSDAYTPEINKSYSKYDTNYSSATIYGYLLTDGFTNTSAMLLYGSTDHENNISSWDNTISIGNIENGEFSIDIQDLSFNTQYNYRFYIYNSEGSDITNALTFTSDNTPELSNIAINSINNITYNSCVINGTLLYDGNYYPSIDIYYGLNDGDCVKSDWENKKSVGIIKEGNFSSQLYYILSSSLYYCKICALNIAGESWSNTISFSTLQSPIAPIITNLSISNLKFMSVTCNALLEFNGNEDPEIHIYWGPYNGGNIPSMWKNHSIIGYKTTNDTITYKLTTLLPTTKYYFTFYAKNGGDSYWATPISFTTISTPIKSSILSLQPSNITDISLTFNGKLTSSGGDDPSIIIFYGKNNGDSIVSEWENKIEIGITSEGNITYPIEDLESNTKYYFQMFATNYAGSSWSNIISTSTQLIIHAPTIEVISPSNIGGYSATCNGRILNTGYENPHVTLYWGTNDGHQTVNNWEHSVSLGILGNGMFTYNLTGLNEICQYYYQVYAENSSGGAWSVTSQSFVTLDVINQPTIVLLPAKDIIDTSASIGCDIIDNGGEAISMNLYWGKINHGTDYNLYENVLSIGTYNSGSLYNEIENLEYNTIYYYIFTGTNSGGTGISNISSFKSSHTKYAPNILNIQYHPITTNSIKIIASLLTIVNYHTHIILYYGKINGGENHTNWENKIDLGYKINGLIDISLHNIIANKQYYFKFYAKNAQDEIWTDTYPFVIDITITAPTISVNHSNITPSKVKFNFDISNLHDNEVPNITLYYGTTNHYHDANSWENKIKFDFASISDGFSYTLQNLLSNTKYYYAVYISNISNGNWEINSNELSFTTLNTTLPLISDINHFILKNNVIIKGKIDDTGGSPIRITIFYGINDCGENENDWDFSQEITNINNNSFFIKLINLHKNSKYFYTIKIENSVGYTFI